MLKKNMVLLIIILLTIGLVLLVIWVYDQRIHHLEKSITLYENTRALISPTPISTTNTQAI